MIIFCTRLLKEVVALLSRYPAYAFGDETLPTDVAKLPTYDLKIDKPLKFQYDKGMHEYLIL